MAEYPSPPRDNSASGPGGQFVPDGAELRRAAHGPAHDDHVPKAHQGRHRTQQLPPERVLAPPAALEAGHAGWPPRV